MSRTELDLPARLTAHFAERYAFERELGRGATATVYLAHDLRLDRPVALKLLRPELTEHVAGERFLREIHCTAALQHPHILPLFDSGEAEGMLWYAMPYVAGESLRTRLQRAGALPVTDAVTLVRALAGALDHAHAHGVVHRDVKPENVLLEEDGQPLLSDFGMALALTGERSDRLTGSGLTVGTPRYMSPEQAAGDHAVGPASDVYALAAVAYELLAGEPPFTGPSYEAVRARVLLDPPRPIRTVRATVPAAVEAAILRGLAKDPTDRFRSAGELASALEAGLEVGAPESSAPAWRRIARRRIARLAAGGGGLVGLALVVVTTDWPGGRSVAPAATTHRQLTYSGQVASVAISPDGEYLAYGARADGAMHVVVVQDLAGGAPDTLATVPAIEALDWSPDGRRLLVGSVDAGRAAGLALVLSRSGDPPRRIGVAGRVAGGVTTSWLPDGRRVSIQGGGRHLLVDLETEDTVALPIAVGDDCSLWGRHQWARDGRRLAVVTECGAGSELRVASMDGRTQLLVRDTVPLSSPQWSGSGDAIYYGRPDGSVWRIALRPTGRASGPPRRVFELAEALTSTFGHTSFSVAADGRKLIYAKGRQYANLVTVERDGPDGVPRSTPLTTGTSLRWSPTVSPDGRWIAFAQEVNGSGELFTVPVDGGTPVRVTSGAQARHPGSIAWSPDGRRLAFVARRDGQARVWTTGADGGELQQFAGSHVEAITAKVNWAPGWRIVYERADMSGLNALDPDTGREHALVTWAAGPAWFHAPQYSSDGNRLAVMVRPPHVAQTGIWVFDLRDGSRELVLPVWSYAPCGWSADGRYIYLQKHERGSTVYRVPVGGAAAPEPFLELPYRDVDCSPVGATRPDAFVCAAFDFVSDVWMVEQRGPDPR